MIKEIINILNESNIYIDIMNRAALQTSSSGILEKACKKYNVDPEGLYKGLQTDYEKYRDAIITAMDVIEGGSSTKYPEPKKAFKFFKSI